MPGIDPDLIVNSQYFQTFVKELSCLVCMDLVRPKDAIQAPCGHLFCYMCVQTLIRLRGPFCPMDKKRMPINGPSLQTQNPIVFRMLSGIKIRCPVRTPGCTWIGEVFDELMHSETCPSPFSKFQECFSKGEEFEDRDMGAKRLELMVPSLHLDPKKQALNSTEYASQGPSAPQRNLYRAAHPAMAEKSARLPSFTEFAQHNPLFCPNFNLDWEDCSGDFAARNCRRPFATISAHNTFMGVRAMAASKEGVLFSSDRDGSIAVIIHCRVACFLKGHGSSYKQLLVSDDGCLLCLAEDRTLRAWKNFCCVSSLHFGAEFIYSIPEKMVFTKGELYVAHSHYGICIFRENKKVETVLYEKDFCMLSDIAVASDGTIFVSGKLNNSISVLKNKKWCAEMPGHTDSSITLAVSSKVHLFSYSPAGYILCHKTYSMLARVRVHTPLEEGVRNPVVCKAFIPGPCGDLYFFLAPRRCVSYWDGEGTVKDFLLSNDERNFGSWTVLCASKAGERIIYGGNISGSISAWKIG